MRIVTRRGLFVVGGTGVAGAALTACGTQIEQRDAGHDQELLDAEASAEAALGAAYANLGPAPQAGGPETADVLDELGKASRARQSELNRLGANATGGPDTGSGSEHAALDAANTAIAAYRTGAGQLSSEERRSVAAAFLAQVAAEVASLSGLAGADQAPEPFVTGLGTKPFESIESSQTSTTSTAAESGSTTSTTTGAGG